MPAKEEGEERRRPGTARLKNVKGVKTASTSEDFAIGSWWAWFYRN